MLYTLNKFVRKFWTMIPVYEYSIYPWLFSRSWCTFVNVHNWLDFFLPEHFLVQRVHGDGMVQCTVWWLCYVIPAADIYIINHSHFLDISFRSIYYILPVNYSTVQCTGYTVQYTLYKTSLINSGKPSKPKVMLIWFLILHRCTYAYATAYWKSSYLICGQ